MLDFSNQQIVLKGKTEPIKAWRVWFMTPNGLYHTMEDALKSVDDSRLVIPVPVAVGDELYEVAAR